MSQRTFTVTGMTCEHCQHAVSTEVSKVSGVQSVDVDLASGLLTVQGDGYTDEQIRDAVDEAGYALAGS